MPGRKFKAQIDTYYCNFVEAIRAIEKDEEIFINYNYDLEDPSTPRHPCLYTHIFKIIIKILIQFSFEKSRTLLDHVSLCYRT